jgi:alpha-mannosidase II
MMNLPWVLLRVIPSFSGDFFAYADRKDNYWTGYYTSRPFYKQFDRVLERHLRSAEIFFTLAQVKNSVAMAEHFAALQESRRTLGLFQHHDGITGTSKVWVTLCSHPH